MIGYRTASGRFLPLTERILELARSLPYVQAFWMHGSRAVGRGVDSSDIDYAFVVSKDAHKSLLQKELAAMVTWHTEAGFFPEQTWYVARWLQGDVYYKTDVHLYSTHDIETKFADIFHNNAVDISNNIRVEKWQNTHFLAYQGEAQFVFGDSLPLYDPEDMLTGLKVGLAKYPEEQSEYIINLMMSYLETKLRWFGEPWIPRNRYHFIDNIRDIVYFIVTAHYAKNGRLMRNGFKRYHHDMPYLRPNIETELTKLLTIDKAFGQEDKAVYVRRIMCLLQS